MVEATESMSNAQLLKHVGIERKHKLLDFKKMKWEK